MLESLTDPKVTLVHVVDPTVHGPKLDNDDLTSDIDVLTGRYPWTRDERVLVEDFHRAEDRRD